MLPISRQIKMARDALDWDQSTLAAEADVSQSTIANIEQGKSENPNTRTLNKIHAAFERHGVIFQDGWPCPAPSMRIFTGKDWYIDLLNDVYYKLLDKRGAEYLTLCGDDKVSPSDVVNMIRKIRGAGIGMRQIVREGNTYLSGPVKEYRYMPKDRFSNHVTLIYGDHVAICDGTSENASGASRAVVFKDASLTRTWVNIFEHLWDTLPEPQRSTADERF